MTTPENENLPTDLKWLKRLVTLLTFTMIAGIASIAILLSIRLSATQSPALPETITLPQGVQAQAITTTATWYAVVTTDERILIYGYDGTLRQEIRIEEE